MTYNCGKCGKFISYAQYGKWYYLDHEIALCPDCEKGNDTKK